MKKTAIFLFAIILFFAVTDSVKAQSGSLPDKNNPFWNIAANMQTPDDEDCVDLATAELQGTYYERQEASLCAGIAQIMNMERELSNTGVETNLFDQANWHEIDGLYFEIPGVGKIEFTKKIDFMSYSFLTFVSTLTERMDMKQGEIRLDADIVDGLSGYGAVLTMYNAGNFNDPEILVNGKTDTEGIVSNLEYNPVTRDITFNAAHFTTFTAVEKNTEKKPKINNISIGKFKNSKGEKIIKITLKGKNFKKKTEVTLGGKKASKVSYKSSKKIVATFKLKNLEKTGKHKLKLKAYNNKKVNQYRDNLLLTKLIQL